MPQLKKRKVKKIRADYRTRFKKGHLGYVGENNPIWKGDEASYESIHIWLKTHFGKANECQNKLCVYPRRNKAKKIIINPKRYNWALLKGKNYSHNRANFIKLCSSCHKKYDKNYEKIKI